MSARSKKINLLVRTGFENTTTGRVLGWLLSVGRTIVIVTEIVVIASFISRFWFDRRLTDLAEQNNIRRTQVEAASSFEKEFRSTQERLSLYEKLTASQLPASELITQIAALAPKGVVFNQIAASFDGFSVSGNSLSEEGLSGFLKALSDSSEFEDVVLSRIAPGDKNTPGLLFSIDGKIKGLSAKSSKPDSSKQSEEVPL